MMNPCQHGDLYYKSYGMAYCRCHQGWEGMKCDRKITLQDPQPTEHHWWSNFFDSLRRMIWGPPTEQQQPHPPPIAAVVPQNTVNIVLRPQSPPFGAGGGPWGGIGGGGSTAGFQFPPNLSTTTTAGAESAHLTESGGVHSNANDITFLVGFTIVVFIIFCISCAAVALCCWRIRVRNKRKSQTKKNHGATALGTSASSRPCEFTTRPVEQTRPSTDHQGHGGLVEDGGGTSSSGSEGQPPSYEQAVGSMCVKYNSD